MQSNLEVNELTSMRLMPDPPPTQGGDGGNNGGDDN